MQNRISRRGLVAAAAAAALSGCSNEKQAPFVTPLNDASFGTALRSPKMKNRVALVEIGAPWCPPCREYARAVAEIEKHPPKHVSFFSVTVSNGDKEPTPDTTTLRMLLDAEAIPTMLVVMDGEIVKRLVGFGGREELNDIVKRLDAIMEDEDPDTVQGGLRLLNWKSGPQRRDVDRMA